MLATPGQLHVRDSGAIDEPCAADWMLPLAPGIRGMLARMISPAVTPGRTCT
jgi:hypothetical protein